MVDNLEETTPAVEVVEPTPKEGEKPTELQKEPTVSITDTPEFKKALDKAVGKGVSSIQSQLSISKANEEAAKAALELSKSLQEATEGRLTELEAMQFADDPEALKGFRLTKSLEVREKRANLREAEQKQVAAEQEGLRMAIILNDKANELQLQYQVPRKVLELCTSEKQMEEIASDYPEVGKKPEETPKFAGAGEQGKGVDLNKMSGREQIAYAIAHPKK